MVPLFHRRSCNLLHAVPLAFDEDGLEEGFFGGEVEIERSLTVSCTFEHILDRGCLVAVLAE